MITGAFKIIHKYTITQLNILTNKIESFNNKSTYYFDKLDEYPELIKNLTELYGGKENITMSIFDLYRMEEGIWKPFGYDDPVVTFVEKPLQQ